MATKTLARAMDLEFHDSGSIAMIQALTEAGRDWLQKNLQAESWQWMGDMLAVEPRCMEDIRDGAIDDGLEVA